jgi:hypothetical protein
LSISHIGNTTLDSSHDKLELQDVLIVPDIKKNLIYVSKLTKDLSCTIEFMSFDFKIKNRITGLILVIRRKQGGLYVLHDGGGIAALAAIKSGRAPKSLWHQRIGHSLSKLLHNLASNLIFDVCSWLKLQTICISCQMGKSCRLLFSLHNKFETYKHYVLFADDHIRYNWLYPLEKKKKKRFFLTPS